jgi:hypothetical protein
VSLTENLMRKMKKSFNSCFKNFTVEKVDMNLISTNMRDNDINCWNMSIIEENLSSHKDLHKKGKAQFRLKMVLSLSFRVWISKVWIPKQYNNNLMSRKQSVEDLNLMRPWGWRFVI